MPNARRNTKAKNKRKAAEETKPHQTRILEVYGSLAKLEKNKINVSVEITFEKTLNLFVKTLFNFGEVVHSNSSEKACRVYPTTAFEKGPNCLPYLDTNLYQNYISYGCEVTAGYSL